jgi:hypothetical protein
MRFLFAGWSSSTLLAVFGDKVNRPAKGGPNLKSFGRAASTTWSSIFTALTVRESLPVHPVQA